VSFNPTELNFPLNFTHLRHFPSYYFEPIGLRSPQAIASGNAAVVTSIPPSTPFPYMAIGW
jgi:hypothetical protein